MRIQVVTFAVPDILVPALRWSRHKAPEDPLLLTPGFGLPNQWVIHTVAVSFIDNPDAELVLARAIDSALKLAAEHGIKSLAKPAIGTGVFRCPPALSADYTARALAWHSRNGSPLERVRVCVTSAALQKIFEQAVEKTFA